ncbi:MAG: helix-turn-helix transcriptional regulator [Pseudobutyrivibrio sp.]|uniref:hypothetical protein n=1 Tax=Pseudobutyrivibrio sp. TaxID=2014367 RepID=UPI0025F6DC08|nr:hypothetical protein [Pseudobutyrivibrio sp.]MBQ6463909.1 helix-turn-helix transcriptional regulator [Pseudobutyrivibrio sp.]
MKAVEAEKSRISKNIKYLLEVKQISRRQASIDLGYKYTTFCDWVNGNSLPSYSVLERLGEYFNVEPWEFYEDISGTKRRARVLAAYASAFADAKLLNMNILDSVEDAQLKSLLQSGFKFRHKTLEEYEGVNIKLSSSSADDKTDISTELSVRDNQLFISNGDVSFPVPLNKVIQIMDIMQAVLDENS